MKKIKSYNKESKMGFVKRNLGTLMEISIRNELPFSSVGDIFKIANVYHKFNERIYSRLGYNPEKPIPELDNEVFCLTEKYLNINRFK